MQLAFIWDMDGTLVDSYPAIVPAALESLSAQGVSYDRESLTVKTDGSRDKTYLVRKTGQPYKGKVGKDYYGRIAPSHAHGTGNLTEYTNSTHKIMDTMTAVFDRIVDPDLLIRRVNIAACNLIRPEEVPEEAPLQLDLTTTEKGKRKKPPKKRRRNGKSRYKTRCSPCSTATAKTPSSRA